MIAQPGDNAPPVIAVASGKGGVGKTTVAVNLALALAAGGLRIGLVDADLYGPDAPRMLGLRRKKDASHITLTASRGGPRSKLEAVSAHGIQVASAAFLLGERQGFGAEAAFAQLLISRLVGDTQWGELDYLVADLPPGMADVQQFIFALRARLVILVVTPQMIAHGDARRLAGFLGARRRDALVIAGVENMAGQICPDCGAATPLFPPAADDETIWDTVPRIASIPYSYLAAREADAGRPVMVTGTVPEQVTAYQQIAEQARNLLRDPPPAR